MIYKLSIVVSLRRPEWWFSTQTAVLLAPPDHLSAPPSHPPFIEMDRTNPRIEMNMDVNMFSQVRPLTRIPVFNLYEYCPVGAGERVVGGVIYSGARMLRVSTKK